MSKHKTIVLHPVEQAWIIIEKYCRYNKVKFLKFHKHQLVCKAVGLILEYKKWGDDYFEDWIEHETLKGRVGDLF